MQIRTKCVEFSPRSGLKLISVDRSDKMRDLDEGTDAFRV